MDSSGDRPGGGALRERRPSPRGVRRRETILGIAIRLLSRNGSRGTSLSQIAMESGITQTGLLHHFPSKDSLLHAALDVRDRTDEYPFRASQWDGSVVFDHVASIVLSWSEHPDIVGMFTALLVENLGEDAPLHSRLLTRYADLRQVIADGLSSAQERGELRRDFEADQKAVEIIAFLNGLETSWLLNPEIPAAAVALSWAAEQKAQLSAGRPAGRRRG